MPTHETEGTGRGLSEVETDSGCVLGDPCEAIIAQFVYGPKTCMAPSVAIAVDAEWGTTHVVCAEHNPYRGGDDGRA